jgi:hypothetical protein
MIAQVDVMCFPILLSFKYFWALDDHDVTFIQSNGNMALILANRMRC